jgi:hypothetical protein
MDNPEKLATLGKQDTGQRLEKPEGAIKNGQSKETANIRYVSLDCPFLIASSVFCNLYPVSCVPSVASFFGLSILDCHFGFL